MPTSNVCRVLGCALVVVFNICALAGLSAQTYEHLTTDFYDIQFADQQTAYAGGEDGVLVKSVDEGATWEMLHVGHSNFNLRALHFLNAERGWFLTGQAEIFVTENGGLNWSRQYAGAIDPVVMHDIEISPSGLGFAVGTPGLVLRTEDFGESWVEISEALLGNFYRIVLGADNSVILAGEGIIMRSSDAGQSWQEVDTEFNTAGVRWTSSFTDVQKRIYLGGRSADATLIIYSLNQGSSWTALNNVPGVAELAAIDQNLVAFNADARPFYTDDLGANWNGAATNGPAITFNQNTPVAHGLASNGNTLLYCTAQHGLMRSVNNGESWTTISFLKSRWGKVARYTADGDIIVGSPSLFARSTDRGATWMQEAVEEGLPEIDIRDLAIVNRDILFAASGNGSILRYDSSAKLWRNVNGPQKEHVTYTHIAFDPTGIGLAIGLERENTSLAAWVISHSNDAGATWDVDDAFTQTDVKFIPEGLVNSGPGQWIVVGTGKVNGSSTSQAVRAFSQDDGNTWEYTAVVDPRFSFLDVQRIGVDVLLASGRHGQLHRSVDRGLNWSRIETGVGLSLNCIEVLGEQSVFVAGRGAGLLSRDAGQTWSPVKDFTRYVAQSIQFITENQLLITDFTRGAVMLNLDQETNVENEFAAAELNQDICLMSISPNPATAKLTGRIKLSVSGTPRNFNVSVHDYLGRQLMDVSQAFTASEQNTLQGEFNIAGLADGLYFLHFTSPAGQFSESFLVQKN